jgi:hypothetical protein
VKDLLEAIVASAQRSGTRVGIVIVDAERNNGNTPGFSLGGETDDGSEATAGPVNPPAALPPEIAATEIEGLRSQYVGALKQRDEATTALLAAQQERDKYSAAAREAEARAAGLTQQLQAAAAGQPVQMPAPGAAQGASQVSQFDGLNVEVLGLEEKLLKSLTKTRGWATIGQLKAALLEGKLKSEAKLSKDEVIGIAERLLGKPPSLPTPAGVGVAAGPASTAPSGHKDRDWKERLTAARRKEAKKSQIMGKLQQIVAEIGKYAQGQVPPQLLQAKDTEEKTLELTNAQVAALLWACGFEFDPAAGPAGFSSVDATLTRYGLVQFIETLPTNPAGVVLPTQAAPQPPQQQMAPQGPPMQPQMVPAPQYQAPPNGFPTPPGMPPQGYPQQPQGYAPQQQAPQGYAPPQGAPVGPPMNFG